MYTKFHIEDVNPFYVILDVILNLWVVILAAAAVWLIVPVIEDVTYVPEYTAKTTYVVNKKGSTNAFSDLNVTMDLAEVFRAVFTNELLVDIAAEEMGMDNLHCQVDAEVIPETNLLTVSVTSGNPEISFRVLNSIMHNYDQIADYILGNALLNVMKAPAVPYGPSNDAVLGNYRKKLTAGMAVLVLAIIIFLSAIRDTVRTPKGARNHLDGDYMGSVSHEDKFKSPDKKAALITNSLVELKFLDDFRKISARISHYMKKNGSKILMISSPNENEGKSTIATNLALALTKHGKKVMIVDCDFRKPAVQKIFDIEDDQITDFMQWLDSDAKTYPTIKTHGLELVVNKNNDVNPQRYIAGDKLANFLQEQKANPDIDYIIVDTPPILVASDAEALAPLCDEALLVVRQNWTPIADINDCLDYLSPEGRKVFGYILNDVELMNGLRMTSHQKHILLHLYREFLPGRRH